MHFATGVLLLCAALPVQEPSADEKAIRAVLDAAAKATNEGDGKSFARQFHADRMITEVYVQAGFEVPKDDAGVQSMRKAVPVAMATMGAQQKSFGGWGEIQSLRVKRLPGKSEVEAACILKDSDGARDRFRFWLVEDAGAWKIYDFESLHDGMRLTILLSSFVNDKGIDPKKARALRQAVPLFQQLSEGAAEGDLEKALGAVQKMDFQALSPGLVALFETFEGGLLAGLDREEEALKVLDRAIGRNPDLPRAHQVRWEVCLSLEKHDEAVRSAKEFIRILGDDPDAYLGMGRALVKLGKADDAAEAFRKGIASIPDDSENRYELGLLLAGRKKTQEAKELLLKAMEFAPDAEDVYDRAAEELMKGDTPDLLLELARERAKSEGAGAPPLYHQGYALRRLGKHAEAAEVLKKALEKDEDEEIPEIRRDLAFVLGHLGRFPEARELAGKIEEDDATTSHLVQAYLHALEGKDGPALEDLRLALQKKPELHKTVTVEPVFARLRAGAGGSALLKEARAQDEYHDASNALWLKDRWDPLRELSAARVRVAPGDAQAWYFLGLSLRKLGRHDQAEKALRSGLEKESDERRQPRFWEEMGQAVARGGRPAEALEWSKKLLTQEDWKAEGHLVAALAHALAGDGKAALKSVEALLEEDPDRLEDVEADPAFAELRADAGYRELVRRVRRKAKQDP